MYERYLGWVLSSFTWAGVKPRAYVFGMSPWKKNVRHWLDGETVSQKSRHVGKVWFHAVIAPAIAARKGSKVYVWGYKVQPHIEQFCRSRNIPIIRVEDGFIRSISLGAFKAPPLSLCFDRSGMYFDATQRSDLEQLIEAYDFNADPDLIARARTGINKLIASRLSKYNTSTDTDIAAVYGPKTDRKRILVVGQVEDDASIRLGCDRIIDNNALVRIAASENPQAQIIYKPHPEVLHGTRANQSDPNDVSDLAMILKQDITLADAFQTVDHVYTITSLSGFEALIRGIPVTCLGMPFYAGWGATDDRQECERRTAKRTPEEIFAAAYILYARYLHPTLHKPLSFEEAIELLAEMKGRVL
ncbi:MULTISPECIES: capsular polysaccharide biosynthesis protein [unclassified Rhizobium]|jgi:capsular polysaccharide export protein|uniref:capsular polysaccharide export protein, LipB/KpsS family n=1 Tax=unclassified Rhizobium TaxID=2613769 RepID=UPI0010CFD60A|nr:capsular polysaccharide export protein [Rhizobium sp. PvP014]MBP2530809.1 capsular polysaccharide export protein [Rhizobium sp. PvP099]RYE65097.1 MAG: capsular polysaccharide biosynthesis protein [Rhizobiaceae bacterium]